MEFLSQHVPLRHLILNNNGLGPAAGILVADALTALALKKDAARKDGKQVPDLETVICGRNRLENGSMAAWAKAFAAHTGVKEVKMVQNGIRSEGITHLLTNGFSHTTKLETLDLQDNTFTATGAQALATVVGNWTEIKDLGVGDCLLSGRGGITFVTALQKSNTPKLEILRLDYNEINSKGLAGLVKALPNLTALRRIEINGNRFDQDDPSLEMLRDEFKKRMEAVGDGSNDDDHWGLNDLDELESEDEDDEDGVVTAGSDDEGVEIEEKAARELASAQAAEEENVPQREDKEVDDLADALAKTEVK